MIADLVEAAAALADRSCLDDVEVTGRVGLQVEGEFVEALGDHEVEVESLVSVALAVAVGVAQLPDAIAAGDIDLAVHDLESERVIEPGGKATPGNLLELIVDTRSDKHIAVEGADHRTTVGQEIESRCEHRGLPRIDHGQFDVVDDIGLTRLLGELTGGLYRLRPERLGDLQQHRGGIGIERLRERHAGRQIGDADRGDILGAIHPGDGVSIDLVDLGRTKRHDTAGILRLTEHNGDALGGRSDFQGPHDKLDLIGRDDLRGLIEGHAADFPADDDRTAGIMETLEASLPGRQRTEALARSERGGVGARHEASEVTGDENRVTHRRRIIPARHQIHLSRELAGPRTDRTTEIEVVGDTLLAIFPETDSQPL